MTRDEIRTKLADVACDLLVLRHDMASKETHAQDIFRFLSDVREDLANIQEALPEWLS